MKNLASLIIAGVFGGMVVLGGNFLLNMQNTPQAYTPETPTQQVSNLNIPKGSINAPFDFISAAEIATPVVVHIAASQSSSQRQQNSGSLNDFFGGGFNQPKAGSGSGVIISEDGYIVTNNHVVEFADQIEVTLSNNKQYKAEIIGTDARTDLAVLKIEEQNLPTLKNADSDQAKIGQWVLAVGNPLELTSTVTAGIISAKGRDINIIPGNEAIESFIQTDAAVNPGNSGGALVDAQGKLLGINTAIATRTGYFTGYSFAIPVKIMEKIVADIIEYGSYQRGYLGITIRDLNDEIAQELGVGITQGVLVEGIERGSAAQFAGLLPNDVITKIDGKSVNSSPELQELVGRGKVGDKVNLKINRKGKSQKITVQLKARD